MNLRPSQLIGTTGSDGLELEQAVEINDPRSE